MMTREEILSEILKILLKEFEIENPDLDDDLREKYEFDSIDAIELLVEIENLLKTELTQEEKKQAMEIRTINHICDYVEALAKTRA
jgi:acyl carrier protein